MQNFIKKKKIKKIPKIFKKLPLNYKCLGSISAYDSSIGSVAILYNLKNYTQDVEYSFVNSSVLTLQN